MRAALQTTVNEVLYNHDLNLLSDMASGCSVCGKLYCHHVLQAVLMAHEQHCWTVLCSDHNRNAFVRCIARNNIFGSYYHIREPETQQLQMQFCDFAACAAKWKSKTALFDVSTLVLSCFIGDHLPTWSCRRCLHYLAQCAYLVLPNVR